MTVSIDESGIQFGPFDEADLFHIERSPGLKGLGEGIKSVEFVFFRSTGGRPIFIFVEAKKSIPRETDNFFKEIKQKMLDSLVVWALSIVGRHNLIQLELPANMQSELLVKESIYLFLIIPDIPDMHLPGASDKFRRVMNKDCRLWNIDLSKVMVLNPSHAKRFGLVV